jgi:predicted RNA-binding protein with PUA-like domain
MNHWLFKSEPSSWSWEQQKAKGEAGEEWTGVRNFQARKNMQMMQVGDQGFFYHSGEGKEIVGIVEVIKKAHPDSTAKGGPWQCVDIRAVRDLPKPVTLEQCKADKRLKDMVLVKNSRLSVQPVTADEWAIVLGLGGAQ